MSDLSSELQYLRDQVAARFGGRIETTTDYDSLSYAIEARTRQQVSSSTLKRLWGYVKLHPRPRTATLDILAQYAGRKDFRELCSELAETSAFISTDRLESGTLEPHCNVRLRWLPDRCVTLEFIGGSSFRVLDSGTSKLRSGDEFEADSFLKGHPLYINGIRRNGETLPSYVAGRSAGLTGIETL